MSRAYYSPDGQASASDQYQQFTETTPQPLSNQSSAHESGPPPGAPEGYSLVYGDGPFSGNEAPPQYRTGELPEATTFEERLRSLMRQQGDELRAFADREGRNIDEVRVRFDRWLILGLNTHSSHLLDSPPGCCLGQLFAARISLLCCDATSYASRYNYENGCRA